ncbi:MAG: recombinase family protein [Deltaproteobacteria bacterium]|nr:recombinase family protein [Deltaproteobacteria bacterium]
MPTTTSPLRTSLHARVSTTGHGQDVGLQLDELRAVAHQHGWHSAPQHIDDSVSGAVQPTATTRT